MQVAAATLAWVTLAGPGAVANAGVSPGQKTFEAHCSTCHGSDGGGTPGVAPSLAGTLVPYLRSEGGRRYLSQILISGMAGTIRSREEEITGVMPSFASDLDDAAIAATVNYALARFDDAQSETISVKAVADARGRNPTAAETLKLRAELLAAQPSMATTYRLHCSGCHGENGKGVPESGIPDLGEAALYIAIPEGRSYLISVPGLSQSSLSDGCAADLLNYVLVRFSANHLPRSYPPYTQREVAYYRVDKASDAKTRRDNILNILRSRGLPLPTAY